VGACAHACVRLCAPALARGGAGVRERASERDEGSGVVHALQKFGQLPVLVLCGARTHAMGWHAGVGEGRGAVGGLITARRHGHTHALFYTHARHARTRRAWADGHQAGLRGGG